MCTLKLWYAVTTALLSNYPTGFSVHLKSNVLKNCYINYSLTTVKNNDLVCFSIHGKHKNITVLQ